MNTIEILAAKAAIKKMLDNGYFSISTIDSILKVTGGIPRGNDYRTLSLLHCVHYSEMPSELLNELPRMIQKVVESPALDFVIELNAEPSKMAMKFLK